MRFNELNKEQVKNLLEELFSLKGAKEVFEKHGVEMITKDIEIKELFNFIEDVKALYDNSKTVKEYKQATMFLNTQIKTNEELLKTSEGFMKTMLEGMISGFKATKETATKSQEPIFRKEIEELLERIINDDDRNKVKKLIEELSIEDENIFINKVKLIEKDIENRYSEDTSTKEVIEEKSKKIDKKEEVKTIENPKEKKAKKQVEVQKEDDDEFNGLDDIDLKNLSEKPKEIKEVKEENIDKDKEEVDVQKDIEEMDIPDEDDWLNGFDDEETDLGEIGEVDLENPFN